MLRTTSWIHVRRRTRILGRQPISQTQANARFQKRPRVSSVAAGNALSLGPFFRSFPATVCPRTKERLVDVGNAYTQIIARRRGAGTLAPLLASLDDALVALVAQHAVRIFLIHRVVSDIDVQVDLPPIKPQRDPYLSTAPPEHRNPAHQTSRTQYPDHTTPQQIQTASTRAPCPPSHSQTHRSQSPRQRFR